MSFENIGQDNLYFNNVPEHNLSINHVVFFGIFIFSMIIVACLIDEVLNGDKYGKYPKRNIPL